MENSKKAANAEKIELNSQSKKIKTKSTKETYGAVNLPDDYVWKILTSLTGDLKEYLHEDDLDMISFITRSRDYESYLRLSEIWSLQSMNSQSVLELKEIKARYFLASLLKKFPFPSDEKQRRAKAIEKFLHAEECCREFNTKGFKALVADGERTASFLTYARSFLRKLLGESCPTLKQVMESSRHGPGSNLDTHNGQNSLYYKNSNWPYSCTPLAIPVARFLIESDKRWLGALEDDYRRVMGIPKHVIIDRETFFDLILSETDQNRISFVPKDARTERTIAIEPSMNIMLQLGVENHIRKRLKRWGVDLDDQTKNQRLSRRGSITEEFATIDLAAASDSISIQLCRILLPPNWFDYLMKIRSPKGTMNDRTIYYEKISSMGNGYTFALESAIFTAIIYAVQKLTSKNKPLSDFAVYGDDLIVRPEYAEDLKLFLTKCGFRINTEKSFFQGPIRESCGTDWYRGCNIRPIFLTKVPILVTELFNDYNRIKRALDLQFGIQESETLSQILKWVPESFRDIRGPLSDEEFDSYLHSESFRGFPYIHGAWEYTRLVISPPVVKGCDKFLFRKLMHDLKPVEQGLVRPGARNRSTSCGSRFIVIPGRISGTIRKKVSRAIIWSDEYAFLSLTSG